MSSSSFCEQGLIITIRIKCGKSATQNLPALSSWDPWCSLPPGISLERAHEGMYCSSLFVAICKVSIGGKNSLDSFSLCYTFVYKVAGLNYKMHLILSAPTLPTSFPLLPYTSQISIFFIFLHCSFIPPICE